MNCSECTEHSGVERELIGHRDALKKVESELSFFRSEMDSKFTGLQRLLLNAAVLLIITIAGSAVAVGGAVFISVNDKVIQIVKSQDRTPPPGSPDKSKEKVVYSKF